MMSRQAFGIRWRLWLAAALPALVVVAVLLFGFLDRHGRELTAALSDRARTASAQLGGAAEFPLFAGDMGSLQRLADAAMAGDTQLRGVAIYPLGSRVPVESGRLVRTLSELPPDALVRIDAESLRVVYPIRPTMLSVSEDPFAEAQGVAQAQTAPILGHVVMDFTLEALQRQQRDALWWSLAVTLLALMVSAVVATFLASSVTSPLRHISGVVDRISSGDLTARAALDEAGVMWPLAYGVNQMAEHVAMNQESLREQVLRATDELRKQKEAAEMAARIDPLTGARNRRAFTEAAEIELQRALRYGTPLSLIMIDLDHFKSINDTYGHATGDAVLASFARSVAQEVREVDVVGRYGGEEFVVLLPNTEVTEALRVAERMRLAVAGTELQVQGQVLRYTASFGVAALDARELNLGPFIARADAALYQAKRAGRNRVELAPAPVSAA